MYKLIISIAAFLGMSAVAMAAYAAHGLMPLMSSESYESIKTSINYAVNMQLTHALVLLVIGLWIKVNLQTKHNTFWLTLISFLMLLGIGLFAGMIYLSRLFGLAGVTSLVPVGGVCLIAAWCCLIFVTWFEFKC